MKGLIIKDLMFLRKNAKVLLGGFIGIIILGVLMFLSYKYGNIHRWNLEAIAEGTATLEMQEGIYRFVFILFLMVPLMVAAEPVMHLDFDGKAGFSKVSSVLPIPVWKRVAAKYISYIFYVSAALLVDIVIAVVASRLVDFLPATDLIGTLITCTSFIVMAGALTIFFVFCFGYSNVMNLSMLAVLLLSGFFILINWKTVKEIFTIIFSDGSAEYNFSFFSGLGNSIVDKSWIMLVAAIIVYIMSYIGSVIIAYRKRGII